MRELFLACDPDTKSSAYAIVDAQGKLVSAWVVRSKNLESCSYQHAIHLPEVEAGVTYHTYVESQQFYNGDDPRKVKSMFQLARACGVIMMYVSQHFSQPSLILPRIWSKGKPKKHTSFWTLKNMGYSVKEAKGGYCYAEELLPLIPMGQQKHVVDAISIAQYAREQYQTKQALSAFKDKMK